MQKITQKTILFASAAILAISLSGCTDFFEKFITPMYTIEQRPASEKVIDLSDVDAAKEAMEELLDNLTKSNAVDTAKALAKIAGDTSANPAVQAAAAKNAVQAAAGVVDLTGILSSVADVLGGEGDILDNILGALSGDAGKAEEAIKVIAPIVYEVKDDSPSADWLPDSDYEILELKAGIGQAEALPLLALTLAALSNGADDEEGDLLDLLAKNILGVETLPTFSNDMQSTAFTDAQLIPVVVGSDPGVIQFAISSDADADSPYRLYAAVLNTLLDPPAGSTFDLSIGETSLTENINTALGDLFDGLLESGGGED